MVSFGGRSYPCLIVEEPSVWPLLNHPDRTLYGFECSSMQASLLTPADGQDLAAHLLRADG